MQYSSRENKNIQVGSRRTKLARRSTAKNALTRRLDLASMESRKHAPIFGVAEFSCLRAYPTRLSSLPYSSGCGEEARQSRNCKGPALMDAGVGLLSNIVSIEACVGVQV